MHLIRVFNRWLIDVKNTLADCKCPLTENHYPCNRYLCINYIDTNI